MINVGSELPSDNPLRNQLITKKDDLESCLEGSLNCMLICRMADWKSNRWIQVSMKFQINMTHLDISNITYIHTIRSKYIYMIYMYMYKYIHMYIYIYTSKLLVLRLKEKSDEELADFEKECADSASRPN